jgi:hypothetical protein
MSHSAGETVIVGLAAVILRRLFVKVGLSVFSVRGEVKSSVCESARYLELKRLICSLQSFQ